MSGALYLGGDMTVNPVLAIGLSCHVMNYSIYNYPADFIAFL